jgi:hypothetical protein
MVLAAGVRWSFRDKDAGSVRIESDTGATEDAALGASSAARRHSHYSAEPSYGSVWTITSTTSGRSRRMRSSISLALA